MKASEITKSSKLDRTGIYCILNSVNNKRYNRSPEHSKRISEALRRTYALRKLESVND